MRLDITTAADPRVAGCYRAILDPKFAMAQDVFVIEGRQAVARLIAARKYIIDSILLTDTACAALETNLQDVPAHVPVYVTSAAILSDVAGFAMHRGCIALAHRPAARTPEDVLADARTVIVLEAVGNPDNVGAIFRVGQALGAEGVLLDRGCADPLYRKAIRTSAAATLAVPYAHFDEWAATSATLRERGFTSVALTPRVAATSLHDLAAQEVIGKRLALLVGAEGQGLKSETMEAADLQIRVPMRKGIDSINLAVAAAIALYHLRPLPGE